MQEIGFYCKTYCPLEVEQCPATRAHKTYSSTPDQRPVNQRAM